MPFRSLRWLALFLLLLLAAPARSRDLPGARPAEVGVSAEGLAALDAYVRKAVNAGQVPGAVVGLARHGKVVHLKGIGPMALESDGRMPTDAIFRIASMTKPVTSVAVMILVDDGRVALDDPVSKYIPEFKNPRVFVKAEPLETKPVDREITLRDLLTHTAGLTYPWHAQLGPLYRKAEIACGLSVSPLTVAENARRIAALPLVFTPGERWEYSVSDDVLGRVIEVAAGMPFEKFLRERLFAPLGMDDTGFQVPAEKRERIAPVYVGGDNGKLSRLPDGKEELFSDALPYAADFLYRDDNRYRSGGGGLCSTANDYLRFCQMLLSGGQLDGKRVLREDTARAIHTNQIGSLAVGSGEKFGFGFRVVEKTGENQPEEFVGSYSWGGFFGTLFWVVPKEDWTMVVMLQQVGGKRPGDWQQTLERLGAAAVE